MSFVDALKTCLVRKYATFSGRATRTEFWWFMLFWTLAVAVVEAILGDGLSGLAFLALLVPGVAVTSRRLHDAGMSGWWQLVMPIPVFGLLFLLFWFVQPSEANANKYGEGVQDVGV